MLLACGIYTSSVLNSQVLEFTLRRERYSLIEQDTRVPCHVFELYAEEMHLAEMYVAEMYVAELYVAVAEHSM